MTPIPQRWRKVGAHESAIVRKTRTRLIPYLFLLYIVAFLDRTNVGFAALTMNRELGISSAQYGFLTGIFFWGYFLFEIPSNVMMHRVGGRVWIARILVSWGIVALLTGFVRDVHQLYIARFLLGVAEAGFFPGIIFYLTYWFRERDRAQSLAMFIAAAPVSGVLGAPISVFILDHVHWLGLSGWRWLLVLEGLPAIACGVLTYFILPSGPAEARFLSKEEKDWIVSELAREEQDKVAARSASALSVFAHNRVWHLALIWFTYQIGVYAMYFWMPQLLKSRLTTHSNTLVGMLVMVPYMAAVLAMFLVSRSSDRNLERRYHGAVPLVLAAVAMAALGKAGSPVVTVLLWCVIATGICSFNGPFWAVPSEFLSGLASASGIALINSVGNLGGFVGPFALGWIGQKTGSLYTGLAFAGASMIVSALLMMGTGVVARKRKVTVA